MPNEHSIGALKLLVDVESRERAAELQTRIREINGSRFVPVIARVLSEFSIESSHIEIANLKLNLGTIPEDRFDEQAADRLELQLREALGQLFRDTTQPQTTDLRTRSTAESQLELIEFYLTRGTLPFWARPSEFDFGQLFAQIGEHSPKTVAAMIVRLGSQDQVLNRLVFHLNDSQFERLIHLLDPQHASLILAYRFELHRTHRIERLIPLNEERFAKQIRLLILIYLTRDRGTHFNRKSFMKSVLQGMANRERIEFLDVLRSLESGLLQAERRQPTHLSLTGLIRELILDERAVRASSQPSSVLVPSSRSSLRSHPPATDRPHVDHIRKDRPNFDHDPTSSSGEDGKHREEVTEIDSSSIDSPAPFDSMATTSNEQPWTLEHERFAKSRGRLHPANSDFNAARLASLRDFLLTGNSPENANASWHSVRHQHVTLDDLRRWLTTEHRSQILKLIQELLRMNRIRDSVLIDRLLEIADRTDLLNLLVSHVPGWMPHLPKWLSGNFQTALRKHDSSLSTTGSLRVEDSGWSALFNFLVHSPSRSEARYVLPAVVEGILLQLPAESQRLLQHWRRLVESKPREMPASTLEALHDSLAQLSVQETGLASNFLFDRYDRVASLRYYFQFGHLPWPELLRNPDLREQSLFESLVNFSIADLRIVFDQTEFVARVAAIEHSLHRLPPESHIRLLNTLVPETTGRKSPFRETLAQVASSIKDLPAFYAFLFASILEGRPLDIFKLVEDSQKGLLTSAHQPWRIPLERRTQRIESAVIESLGSVERSFDPTLSQSLSERLANPDTEFRQFMSRLLGHPTLRQRFLKQVTNTQFEQVLNVLSPPGLPQILLTTVFRNLNANSPDRNSLCTALLVGRRHPETDHAANEVETILRLLNMLFPLGLSEPIQDDLLRSIQASSQLSATQRANFETALNLHMQSFVAETSGSSADKVDDLTREGDQHSTKSASQKIHHAPLRYESLKLVGAFLFNPTDGVLDTPASTEEHTDESVGRNKETFVDALFQTLEDSPTEVRTLLRRNVGQRSSRERWAKRLPESALVRMFFLLEPQRSRELLNTAELWWTAWLTSNPASRTSGFDRAHFWAFLIEFVSGSPLHRSPERLSVSLLAHFGKLNMAMSSSAEHQDTGERLLESADKLAFAAGNNPLRTLLKHRRRRLLHSWSNSNYQETINEDGKLANSPTIEKTDEPTDPSKPSWESMGYRKKSSLEKPANEDASPIYVNNAGLVLAANFLPRLFQSLEMLKDGDDGKVAFRDVESASRAVHLLQFLVDGSISTPEPQLALNKALCGIPIEVAIEPQIEMDSQETEICESLLRSMIAHWESIKNTSIEGLQETFMQREGKLQRSEDAWRLHVQRKTLDVLVDRVPWSFSVLNHSWMARPIYVNW